MRSVFCLGKGFGCHGEERLSFHCCWCCCCLFQWYWCSYLPFDWKDSEVPCCAISCCVAKWVGHTYTHTPSPSDSMPISTITNCGLEFPGHYHRFPLAGHSMYSVCRSQSQTPSPCCCGLGSFGTNRVFQGWESVSVPCTRSFVSCLSVPLRSGIIRCLSFPVYLHLGW